MTVVKATIVFLTKQPFINKVHPVGFIEIALLGILKNQSFRDFLSAPFLINS